MADRANTMVLRSFHLPQGMDDELRGLAFALRCSKADLVRFFINQGVEKLQKDEGSDWRFWTGDQRARVAKDVLNVGASASLKQGLTRDVAQFG